MKVIMISGLKGSGKDTFADLLMCYLIKHGIKVDKIANAQYVKDVATTMFGWDGKKDAKGRKLLIDITEAGYRYEEFFYEKKTLIRAKAHNLDVLIIPDWRYLSTYTYLVKELGAENIHTVRISRKDTTKDTPELDNDISERGLNTFPFEAYVINNEDIDSLDRKVEPLLRKLGLVVMK